MLSGIVYYKLVSGEIHIGRKSGNPVPEIILGAIGIKPNHAVIKLTKKGLFELKVCDADAANTTMVNGKNLSVKTRSKVLNHCDRISFAGGVIYIFKFPILKRVIATMLKEGGSEQEGISDEIKKAAVWETVQDQGLEGIDHENPT